MQGRNLESLTERGVEHDEAGLGKIDVFLDRNSVFEGKMTFEGIFHLDGKVVGEIVNSGTLILGETAVVRGTLGVNALILNGRVEGDVNAKERVEILSKGKIYGTITAPILVIQDGGIFEGDCKMTYNSNDERCLEGARTDMKSDLAI
ncbi:MAG: bactofilin family protein [Thermodesulfobacteriota bacterium]